MPIVDAVLARVCVEDMDQALPLYVTLSGTNEIRRFRTLALGYCGVQKKIHVWT